MFQLMDRFIDKTSGVLQRLKSRKKDRKWQEKHMLAADFGGPAEEW